MAYDFNNIAANYDRMNHLMTGGLDRRWRRRAVKSLTTPLPAPDRKVLDVACGTGDLTLALMQHGWSVTGIDLSDEMLQLARCKVQTASHLTAKLPPSFQQADAEHLPFPDHAFDAVACAFGVRNFVHLELGLIEMLRVLKPGGRLAILELATPDSPMVRPFYNVYTRRIIPWLGQRLAGSREAYTYLPHSIERFPKGRKLCAILEDAGFIEVREQQLTFGVCRLYTAVKQQRDHA